MSLLETIKLASSAAEGAGCPTDFLFGEVSAPKPLAVRVDDRFTLTAAFLAVPEHVRESGLQKGDKLALLRKRGGELYLVLGKV